MQKLLFRNRYFAAIWALAMLASVAAFFGNDGGNQQIEEAAKAIRAQKQDMTRPGEASPVVIEDETSDEELSADEQQVDEADSADAGEDAGAGDSDTYVVMDKSTQVEEASDEELASREIP